MKPSNPSCPSFDEGDRPCPWTDLACESGRPAAAYEELVHAVGAEPVTVTRRRETDGRRTVTLSCGRITARGEEDLPALAALLAGELRRMATDMVGGPPAPVWRVLVVGLGNADMTPDAIGPDTVRRLTATRHLKIYNGDLFAALGCCELAAFAPGVMGQTGMESGEIVQSAASLIRPDLIIAIDALAARSCERLASTVQLSDGGIAPGSGIGNHRMAIDRAGMGCPVLGLGVPTVVDSATLVWDALGKAGLTSADLPPSLAEVLETGRRFIVSPRDADRMVELTARWLARALDLAFGVGDF